MPVSFSRDTKKKRKRQADKTLKRPHEGGLSIMRPVFSGYGMNYFTLYGAGSFEFVRVANL
jgi:hypothetical protein